MVKAKRKKRTTKKKQAAKKPEVKKAEVVAKPLNPGMAFYEARIKEFEHKGRGLYIGICPSCGKKELRIFDETPVEVRCAKCRFWTYGADQFEEFINKYKPEVEEDAGSEDQSEGRGGEDSPETPESQIH